MKKIFRQARKDGMCSTITKVVTVPMDFLFEYSITIQEADAWNRLRMCIVVPILVFAFLWLGGSMQGTSFSEDAEPGANLNFYIGLIAIGPGALLSVLIWFKTKPTEGPRWLTILSACIAFIMALVWVQFASNEIMDILQLFGFITTLPEALLALTLISWGNCLADLSANLAMTNKGFGEMAFTGCIAGPIFNMLIGLGLTMLLSIFGGDDPLHATVTFSLYDDKTGEIILVSILPLVLLIA